MRQLGLPSTLAVLGVGLVGQALPQTSMFEQYSYYPALISTASADPGRTNLLMFPFQGESLQIPIHSLAGPFTFSPNGKSIYGQCTPPDESAERRQIAVCRFDPATSRTVTVRGSVGLYAMDIAISNQEDHVLVSGVRRDNGDQRGIFDVTVSTGEVRMVTAQADAHPKFAWRHLSFGPDGKVVASRNGRVEIIDLTKGTPQDLPGDLFMAKWSPDGRWLAAVEDGENGRTILMDTNLAERRTLEHSELDWSPDSRYLLRVKMQTKCGPSHGTLEVIDIETGKTMTVVSSECRINQAITGWVVRDIRR